MRGWLDRAADFLAPRVCAACRCDLSRSLQGPCCGGCLAAARPLDGPRCARCGIPDDGPDRLCRRCRERLFAVDRIRAAFAYHPPVRELLHSFKYGRRRDAGRLLAGWLAGGVPRFSELHRVRVLVAVPLHPARLRERGFNQADVLAEAAARALKRPRVQGLRRRRATAAQWGLSRDRRRSNLEGAFEWDGPPPPRSVLLVDDVCTSGATLEACGRALQAAGVEEISALVLARD